MNIEQLQSIYDLGYEVVKAEKLNAHDVLVMLKVAGRKRDFFSVEILMNKASTQDVKQIVQATTQNDALDFFNSTLMKGA